MSVSRILSYFVTAILISSLFSSGFVPLVHSQGFQVPVTVATYGNAWEGELVFGLWQPPANSYLVIMKTNGQLDFLRQSNDLSYIIARNVTSDTIMFMGEPVLGQVSVAPLNPTHFWNYAVNTTVDFPNVTGHHDIVYNPINNTFLTLRDYLRTVNGTDYLYDKIVELNSEGNILWSWDTFDYIPLSQADPFNPTAVVNGTVVPDFTHANSLDWDYKNSIIYLNCRHTNTFYKINKTSSNLIWSCGEHGNFTLLSDNGTIVPSLWYHSHTTRQVEPNVFSMFDNDFDNETNPNNCRSRMIEVTVNEQNMTAWVNWSWSAPTQYWTPFWGKADRLPNGDRIGTFGSYTHQFPQNQPWGFNDTGAVLVEVNPQGQVVRTYTFQAGWGVYRIEEMDSFNVIPEFPGTRVLFIGFAIMSVGIAATKVVLKKRLE